MVDNHLNTQIIKLKIFYESKLLASIDCRKDSIIEKVLQQFIKEDFSSLYFLHAGDNITKKIKQNIFSIMDNTDKKNKEVTILIYKSDGFMIIFDLEYDNGTSFHKKNINKDEPLSKICLKFISSINQNFNSFIFKYKNKEFDLNKKFDDIADQDDKENSCIIISVSKKFKYLITISFIYNNNSIYKMNCYNNDKINDIFKIYARNNNLNFEKLSFQYKKIPLLLNEDTTFNNSPVINIDNCQHLDNSSMNIHTDENIIINVFDIKSTNDKSCIKECCLGCSFCINRCCSNTSECCTRCCSNTRECCTGCCECCTKEKVIWIIIIIIIIGGIIVYVIYQTVLKKKKEKKNSTPIDDTTETDDDIYEIKNCDIGYKSVKGECKPDFLIKATYYSTSKEEEVNLIYSSISYVKRMIIDGKNVTPTSKYNFPKEGYHTVYFKFSEYHYYSVGSIFYGLDRIFSVNFSDFREYIPSISFYNMFNGCTNLTTVDLSNYTFNMNHDVSNMFANCYNLKYVKLGKINTKEAAKYMFYNCKSLTSIDISELNITLAESLNNMFEDCKSLKTINLKGLNMENIEEINYMFSNCSSLISIDLSDLMPKHLISMKGVFKNCISLTSINFKNFYTHNVENMNNLFYNCTSLKFINISDFNTQNVIYLNNMFNFCTSLTSIIVSKRIFVTNKVINMNSMFSHCYSLSSIDLNIFDTSSVTDMNYLFSNCTSLTSIDLSKLDTSSVIRMYSLFSDCHSLTSIDLSYLNTKKVIDFSYMFYNCYSLKSINFSQLNTDGREYDTLQLFSGCFSLTSIDLPNLSSGRYLFYDCPNLKYVNLSSYTSFGYPLFNKNISEEGKIILTNKYYDYNAHSYDYIPSNWTFELV